MVVHWRTLSVLCCERILPEWERRLADTELICMQKDIRLDNTIERP